MNHEGPRGVNRNNLLSMRLAVCLPALSRHSTTNQRIVISTRVGIRQKRAFAPIGARLVAFAEELSSHRLLFVYRVCWVQPFLTKKERGVLGGVGGKPTGRQTKKGSIFLSTVTVAEMRAAPS